MGNISKNMPIGFRVSKVRPKIFNNSCASIFLYVIIEPTNKNLFIAKFVNNTFVFILFLENYNLWMSFECNLVRNVYSNYLPNKT